MANDDDDSFMQAQQEQEQQEWELLKEQENECTQKTE